MEKEKQAVNQTLTFNSLIGFLTDYIQSTNNIFKQELRIQWRLSTILKTSNKSVWSNVFWYVKVYIPWKFIQYTMHWHKT